MKKKIVMIVTLFCLVGIFYMIYQITLPLDKVLPKQQEAFGVKIYATNDVPDEKIAHAKAILSEYLDNDEDGTADNPKVVKALQDKKAGIIITKDSTEAMKMMLHQVAMKEAGNLQDLYASEIHINGAENGQFDGSLEEILHLITQHGYANVYPNELGEKSGTTVALAMDTARGGHFEKVPEKYPENAWYTYYDSTADYATMITEYIYWSLTSILGAQNYEGRYEMIKDEWQLNTHEKVKVQDPSIYSILTNPEYKFPTQLPDGKYNPHQ